MLTSDQKFRIVQMRNLNISYRDISKYIGVPKSTIWDFCKELTYKGEDRRYDDVKRVIVLSDLHCGSLVGLTPPKYQINYNIQIKALQDEMWKWYVEEVNRLGRVDYVLCLGDSVDGKGKKSGGTEQLTTDLSIQAQMAVECIKQIDFNDIRFVRGTAFHVSSDGEEIENQIAREFLDIDGLMKDRLFVDINGYTISMKHKLPSTSVLSGVATPLLKEGFNSRNNPLQPNADLFLYGHVHKSVDVTIPHLFRAISCPALQSPSTRYGLRDCGDNIINFGFIYMEIPDKKKLIVDTGNTEVKYNDKTVSDIKVKFIEKQLDNLDNKIY